MSGLAQFLFISELFLHKHLIERAVYNTSVWTETGMQTVFSSKFLFIYTSVLNTAFRGNILLVFIPYSVSCPVMAGSF
jgi:hypothetical protein